MSKRKIVVGGKEYRYTVGKSHTKIDDVGVFINEKIGLLYTGGDLFAGSVQYVVRPSDIEREIKKFNNK